MNRWDEKWRQGDTPWDKGEAAPPLLEYLALDGAELRGATHVLAPGCGSGHDVRALERAGLHTTGLDFSPTALEVARAMPKAGSEDYLCGDFFESAGWVDGRRFDAIWEHTCFCAIDRADRIRYARSAAALLPPGGILAGVFFLDPPDMADDDDGPPFRATVEEISALLAPWFAPVRGYVPAVAYPGREGREWLGVFRRRAEGEVASAG